MISMKRLPPTLALLAAAFALWSLPALAQQPTPPRFSREDLVFFEEKVRPLLHGQCLTCHSRGKKTSGLSLETREEILAGGNRGPAAEPGKPDHSRLFQALTFTGDLKMPPMGKLKPEEIAVFQRWVEAGLPWPDDRATRVSLQTPSTHWSFQPLRQPAEPGLKDKAWARNSIDKFILARLEKEGLKPLPEADKVTLIRRLLHLLGIDHTKLTFRFQGRDFRLTDVAGEIAHKLLA
jgi:Planctomycete cytochrome C